MPKRVMAYIDGFNLYYGLRDKGLKRYYWLCPYRLVSSLLRDGQNLVGVKYFSARVRGADELKRRRQGAYLDAVRAASSVEIILGKYYRKPKQCFKCQHRYESFEEKMTDCAIVAHMVADAFTDSYDSLLIVGGDTDLIPGVKLVRHHFPTKWTEVWFPPGRKNDEVARACQFDSTILIPHLAGSQLPSPIAVAEGIEITRPPEWT